MTFDLNNPNMAYLRQLPQAALAEAIEAEFIDEPIWSKPASFDVIAGIEALRFAVTNIYVYGLVDGRPVMPSLAVYDREIPEALQGTDWGRIVKESTSTARAFVEAFSFPPSDPLRSARPAFSFWAFDEHMYRGFQASSR